MTCCIILMLMILSSFIITQNAVSQEPLESSIKVEIDGSNDTKIEHTLYWGQEAEFEFRIKNTKNEHGKYTMFYGKSSNDWQVSLKDVSNKTGKYEYQILSFPSGKQLEIDFFGKSEITYLVVITSPSEPVDEEEFELRIRIEYPGGISEEKVLVVKVLTDQKNDWVLPTITLMIGGIAVLFSLGLTWLILKKDRGNKKMIEISDSIRQGAMAYLNRQY